MKSRFLFASFFVLPIALTAPPVQAQSFSVTTACDEFPNSNGALFGPAIVSYGTYHDTHTGPTSASARAYDYYADNTDGTYPQTINSTSMVAAQQGLISGSITSRTAQSVFNSADAKANWTDSLTVASSSLTFGKPVQIVVLASYRASVFTNLIDPLGNGFNPLCQATLNFDSTVTEVSTGKTASRTFTVTDQPQFSVFGPITQHNHDITLQATLDTTVGATVNISSLVDMEIVGGTNYGGFKLYTEANINSFSSALFVNAPANVSILSASGHSYASTPEPAALPVFAVGISVFFFGMRRRVGGRS